MYIYNTYVCTCKDLPQRPYGMKPTYNMLLSINHNQPLLALYPPSQIHSNPPPNEYFCCHIDPHCERDCGRCVEYHLNVQTDDLVQSFS